MKQLILIFGILLLMVLWDTESHAEETWLCRDASSVKHGSTITACGVAESQDLNDARNQARDHAITEFHTICDASADCRDFDYNVIPKRTECQLKGSEQVCYRAIDFEILSKKRRDVFVDLDQANAELSNPNLDEGTRLKLEALTQNQNDGYRYTSQLYSNSFRTFLTYWSAAGERDMSLGLAYEYRPVHWVGLQLAYAHGGDMSPDQTKSDADVPSGAANTSNTLNGTMSYDELSVAALVYTNMYGSYFKAEAGSLIAKREMYDVSYGPLGTGTFTKSKQTTSRSFQGLELGFDSRCEDKGFGAYFEIGARISSGYIGPVGTIGLNYGY